MSGRTTWTSALASRTFPPAESSGWLSGGGRHGIGDGSPVAYKMYNGTLGSTLDGLSEPRGIVR